jgi:hypothetical protein
METIKKIPLNRWVQWVSFILLGLTFSGLAVNPDETANQIVTYLSNGQFAALIILIVGNLGNIFYQYFKGLKENPGKFWAFIDSVNFWISFGNVVAGIVFMTSGIQIDEQSLGEVIALIFSKEYWEAGTLLLVNIIIPILKELIPKKLR